MRGRVLTSCICLTLVSGILSGYEWKSHNRMAYNARRLALTAEPDPQLAAFLEDLQKNGFGEDLDSRAGTSYDPFVFFGTDEDSLEGKLNSLRGGGCFYDEIPCFLRCSVDHFSPALELPLAGQDALVHARWYFGWAVRLYKAGICRPTEREIYHRWAARALGHAMHLVQDMGSPQHVGPENHAPIWAGGDGRSYHEQWTLRLWEKVLQESFPSKLIGANREAFRLGRGVQDTLPP
jgi:hypothetical protein